MKSNGKIQVLFFTNTVVRAGVEEHMLMLARRLDRNRFELHFVCPDTLADAFAGDFPADVPLHRLNLHSMFQFPALWRLFKLVHDKKIDIAHSHMFQSSRCAMPVFWLARVPVRIETTHVRERWRTGIKANYVVDRIIGWMTHRFVAVSSANADYLKKEKRIPAKKIAVIHNGCDLERLRPDAIGAEQLRKQFGIGTSDLVLLVAARLEPQKGHAVILRAMPEILRRFPNARLVCVGSGALEQELRLLTKNLNLEKAVIWAGFQSNIAAWYQLATLTVLPSFYEGLPLTAVESLAAERTLVASAVDGTVEVVIDGKTGLTFEAGNSEALAEKVCKLLGDAGLRCQLSAAGRELVMRQFTHQHQTQATQEIYVNELQHAGHAPLAAYAQEAGAK